VFADELSDVYPPLLVRLEGLLKFIFMRTLIVVDGELRLQGFGAAVACGNKRVVLGVVFPEATRPVEGHLIGERGLRTVSHSCIVTCSESNYLIGKALVVRTTDAQLASLGRMLAVCNAPTSIRRVS
jgi:hypothetical protein